MPASIKPVSAALRGSLRLRLLLGTLVWIAASIIVAGWTLSELFQQHVAQQFYAELNTHLDQLTAHIQVDPSGKLSLSVAQSDPRFRKPLSGLYWQIDELETTARQPLGVLRSRSLWDEVLTLPLEAHPDGTLHQHRIPGPGKSWLGVVELTIILDDTPQNEKKKIRILIAADEQ